MAYIDHPLTKKALLWVVEKDGQEVTVLVDEEDTAPYRKGHTVTRQSRDNPYYGRFYVGQQVGLHPAADLFMRGVTTATVTKVGRKLVHLTSQFYSIDFVVRTHLIEPLEERDYA